MVGLLDLELVATDQASKDYSDSESTDLQLSKLGFDEPDDSKSLRKRTFSLNRIETSSF